MEPTTRSMERRFSSSLSAPTRPGRSALSMGAAALGDVLGSLLHRRGLFSQRVLYHDALNSLQLDLFADSVSSAIFSSWLSHRHASKEEGAPNVLEPGVSGPIRRNRSCISPRTAIEGSMSRYCTQYVAEVGDRYEHAPEAERTSYFREATLKLMVAAQKATLEAFGIQLTPGFMRAACMNGRSGPGNRWFKISRLRL